LGLIQSYLVAKLHNGVGHHWGVNSVISWGRLQTLWLWIDHQWLG